MKATERNRLEAATREYLDKVRSLQKTGQAREHAYRPAQIALFDAFDDVLAINDAAKSDAGFPDFTFLQRSNTELVRGYGEGKDLGQNLDRVEKSDQLLRYGSYDNLLLTNVLEVRFYSEGARYSEVRLARLSKESILEVPGGVGAFVDEFAAFLVRPPERIRSASRLAEIMGGKARRIRKVAEKMLADGDPAHEELHRVFDLVRKTLSHEMSVAEFADMYAQTLVYGLFAARYSDPDLETFSRQEARDLIGQENHFLRHFFDHIAGASFPDELRFVVNELCAALRASDVRKIVTAHLRRGENKGRDPIIYFYELFLTEYDAEQRKDRGVYYTPTPIVRYIVRRVDAALITDFKLPSGLADSSKKKYTFQVSSGYSATKRKKRATPVTQERTLHRVQVLDPAVGTATFLNETIRHISAKFANQSGLWPAYVEEDLLPRLHGFELMMAPYAIAHIKLAMTLDELGAGVGHQAGIYLTNSLDEAAELDHDLFTIGLAAAFSQEAHRASAIKVETPIMVVMGNPPYSGHSENKSRHANSLVDRYKFEPGGLTKLNERNPKWLNDDYVKFMALSEEMVAKNPDGGVLAMITNNGYLDNPTFRGMRWHLAKTFDSIHVIDLHGSLKKKEKAPDGSKDENVFDIQQGVAIIIAVKTGEKDRSAERGRKSPLARVFHADLFGTRKAKFEALDADAVRFTEVELDPKFLFFQLRDLSGRTQYEQGVRLSDCFNKGVAGAFTGRDSLAVGPDAETMWTRVRRFIELDADEARAEFALGRDGDWTVQKAQADVKDGLSRDRVIPISYRPFDVRWTYFTGRAGGIYYRPRDSVMADLRDDESNLALVVGRQGAATGQGEWNLALIARHVVDLNIFARGGGYVFPRRVRDGSGAWVDNVNPRALAQFGKRLTAPPSADDLFDYIYGVLNSPLYRASAAEFLKSDYPVIPIPADDNEFEVLSAFGARVRQLHLLEADDVQDATQFTTTFPVTGSDVVGRRKYADGKLWINETQYVGNVSYDVWNYRVGGYPVVDKWLKDRKGRKLSSSELLHLQRFLTAIALVVSASRELASQES